MWILCNGQYAPLCEVFFAPCSAYYPEGFPPFWNPEGWEIGEWDVGVIDGLRAVDEY
jgi:hypothetical protein